MPFESRMVNQFWARSPISFIHMMPSWGPFLDPHLLTHISTIVVCLRQVTELGLLTLYYIITWFIGVVSPISCQKHSSKRIKKKELLIDKNNVFHNHMVQVQTCDCTSVEEQLSWKRLFTYMCAHYNSLPFLKEFLECFGYNLLGGHFFYWLQTTIQVFVHRHQQVVHSPHSSRS